MATILLLGIENDLADQLSQVLLDHGHNIQRTDSMEAAMRTRDAQIVFAGGDGPDYRETVRQLTARRLAPPVVLVNRLPENSRWLDALELGAADYCGAPFESTQISWLVSSVLRDSESAATAAAA